MGGTKFVVVKAKELVKTAVFAILGVVIIVGLITFFLRLGADGTDGQYRDGTYTGALALSGQDAAVEVTIADGRIAAVSMGETEEAVSVCYPLLAGVAEEVGRAVVETQSLTVAVSPQNVYSAQLVLDAVADGLAQAKR